jgi:hypothetical protein
MPQRHYTQYQRLRMQNRVVADQTFRKIYWQGWSVGYSRAEERISIALGLKAKKLPTSGPALLAECRQLRQRMRYMEERLKELEDVVEKEGIYE